MLSETEHIFRLHPRGSNPSLFAEAAAVRMTLSMSDNNFLLRYSVFGLAKIVQNTIFTWYSENHSWLSVLV